MPEGHALHRLADDLSSTFAGEHVRASSPQGRFVAAAGGLDGHLLLGAEAWGKQLFIAFEDERFVHVHLGLYGTFAIDVAPTADDDVPPPVGQVRLRLTRPASSTRTAAWADLRGPARCELATRGERDEVVVRLGPDPLREDADPDRAWTRISHSSAPIGTLLMDQTVLAGVGNVYRAEVLFRHHLDPLRPGRTLRASQWQALWDDLSGLMAEGVVANRIDTVRPEHAHDREEHRGGAHDCAGEVYVYRRASRPCFVCGASVRTQVLAGRNLFWCPRCQPAFRSRAGR